LDVAAHTTIVVWAGEEAEFMPWLFHARRERKRRDIHGAIKRLERFMAK
jgi:hypothetical protein